MTEITLNSRTYDIVRDMSDEALVIVRRNARLWRVADPVVTRAVLDGVRVPAVASGVLVPFRRG